MSNVTCIAEHDDFEIDELDNDQYLELMDTWRDTKQRNDDD